jgi:hypothetical protein
LYVRFLFAALLALGAPGTNFDAIGAVALSCFSNLTVENIRLRIEKKIKKWVCRVVVAQQKPKMTANSGQ